MKKVLVTLLTAVIYLLFSVFTGLWAVSWIIWIFYGAYMLVLLFRDGENDK
ncbi:MAG: hypothetical protein MJ079_03380 [Ruminococcus sp.]|nr:hypothetical protein [Ruminococcus sp.]